jgi:plastocyanin
MVTFTQKLLKLVVSASVAVLVAAGCTLQPASPDSGPVINDMPGSASIQPAIKDVAIDNFTFTPSTLTVAAGTTVTWVNHDDVPHTVTSNDKVLASKAMDTDEKFSHLFSSPGTYAYFCAVHKHMTGQVIVK